MRQKIDHERITYLHTVEGKTRRQIAEVTGYPLATVNRIFWSRNLDPRWTWNDKNKQGIEALAETGLTRIEIAEALDIKYTVVSTYICRSKIDAPRHRAKPIFIPVEDVELVASMVNEGKSERAIAAHYGCSSSTVHRFKVTHGIGGV